MNINKIINEEINRFLTETFNESDSKENNKYKEQQEKAKERDGEMMNKEDESLIRNFYKQNKDYFNVKGIAEKIFPDHTPEGAQSQLRKLLLGLDNDNGDEYHIPQRVGQQFIKIIKTFQ